MGGEAACSRRQARDNHPEEGFGKHMSRLAYLFTAVSLAAIGSGSALGLPSAPSLKPRETIEAASLPKSEFEILLRALTAAEEERWQDVRSAIPRLTDPAAKLLLRWEIATDGDSGLGFTELQDALETFSDWPDRARIFEAAEIRISRSSLTATERVTWLLARGPQTGDGILALADAYESLGRREDMERVVRAAWRGRALSNDQAEALRTRYGAFLTKEDYAARVDMLLWRSSIKAAQSFLPNLSPGARRAAEARIGLMTNKKNVDSLLEAVPEDFASDPGLLTEQARWNERRGRPAEEQKLLLRVRATDAPVVGREAIWKERHTVIRRLLRERDYATAYLLARDHGLDQGEGFRDAEWLAGWLALARRREPTQAEAHFRRLASTPGTPISTARAHYWLGEALLAQDRREDADAAYREAARHPFTFYGQLAAERLAQKQPEARLIAFAPTPSPTPEQRTEFRMRPAVRAAVFLADSGRLATFERFVSQLDDTLTSPLEHQMLFDIAQGYLETRAAVRSGKAGLARGIVAPDAVFPVLELPKSPRTGSAEPALVLALSRQESEFNPRAVSSADARGMMQMIPRYAEAEARLVGLPFRKSWLTDDPTYNFRLGRGFLDDLVDDFNGSYILAAAAYNAGPSRAKQWIADFGDPRAGADPVEWIESIPFSETRNYVQRVMENLQVYRHRLTGEPTVISLSDDLRRGRP